MNSLYGNFFRQWLDFHGKADRNTYWAIMATHLAVAWLVMIGCQIPGSGKWISGVIFVYAVLTGIPTASLTVRRLHDVGKSGFWCGLYLIPWIGPILLFGLCCRKSKME